MPPKLFGRHIVYDFVVRLSIRIELVQLSKAKQLVELRRKFKRIISINLSLAFCLHVPLRRTKWPQELQLESPCPAFIGKLLAGFG
jgi:hypothetical protein